MLLAGVLLSGCSLTNLLQPKYASLQITSKPAADVILNGKKMGETPFKAEKLKPQDQTIRLVPRQEGLASWETTVTLEPKVTTVIYYEFAQDRQSASGEILGLEQLADSEAAEIAIVTIPDNASVRIDGQPKGFSPLQLKDIGAGDHAITISAPGFKQRDIDIKVVQGYRLTLDAQLARESLLVPEEATPSAAVSEASQPASPSAEPEPPYVEISETPTGWLRVRSSPSTAQGNEVTTVSPGQKYAYLESNEAGWYKIRLPDGTEGWISGRYAKLVRE